MDSCLIALGYFLRFYNFFLGFLKILEPSKSFEIVYFSFILKSTVNYMPIHHNVIQPFLIVSNK
jgi:hypothetical protein